MAQRGKYKDVVRLLKEKEDEDLNLIAEVGNINCEICLLPYHMLPFQSLGEQTDRKKDKAKKKKKVRSRKKKEERSSNEKNTTGGGAAEETQAEEDEKKRMEETCLEILWAQERHIDGLADEVVSLKEEKKKIEGQRRQIEESLAQKRKEAFQLAEATGVVVPHPFEEDFSEKDPLVRHLEESIKEKKFNLECPVCLEVMDLYHLVFISTDVNIMNINIC